MERLKSYVAPNSLTRIVGMIMILAGIYIIYKGDGVNGLELAGMGAAAIGIRGKMDRM